MFLESDRGSILVGLSEIDNRLEDLLSYYLKAFGPSDEADWMLDSVAGDRPLASLHNRSVMARCLGLIDGEVLEVIDELRSLRNKRAHSTAAFKLTEGDMAGTMEAWLDVTRDEMEAEAPKWPTEVSVAMRRFSQSVSIINTRLRSERRHLQERFGAIEIAVRTKREHESHDPSI
jgi:hypothetical protein